MRAKFEKSPLFLVGKDSRGYWVARKQNGACGGLFVSHAAAVKFALVENGNRPDFVITVPGVLELDFGRSDVAAQPTSDAKVTAPALGRRVIDLLSRATAPVAITQPA
jgi:hypothetical protein